MEGAPAAEPPLCVSFVMSKQDVLDMRADVWAELEAKHPPTPLKYQIPIAIVMGAIIAGVIWLLIRANDERANTAAFCLITLVAAAFTGYAAYSPYSRKTRAKQVNEFVYAPLPLEEVTLIGPHEWRFDDCALTVRMPYQEGRFPVTLLGTVETTPRFLTLKLLNGSEFSLPASAFRTAEEYTAFRDRLSAHLASRANPDSLVTSWLQQEAVDCPECGYDLHKVGSAVCPECGTRLTLTHNRCALAAPRK